MANKDINDVRKWTEFCERLIAKTASGDLKWKDWGHKIGRPEARSPLFVATYKTWRILVFKYAYKYFHDEDRYDWDEEVGMELIDDAGKNEWTFPKVPNRYQLLDRIQFNHSDVQSLLDDVLSDEEDA
jgi:hypothetical protein